MPMTLILVVFACSFVFGVWKYAIKPLVMAFKRGYSDRWEEIHAPPKYDDLSEINRLERIENYDRQIDGYTQLIRAYDGILGYETDDKKRAAILLKQLATLEKLNKTIEKREKLEWIIKLQKN